MLNAYAGQYLEIDLTKQEVKKIPLDKEFLRKYVGGSGIGAALYSKYWALKDLKVEPLSPDNPLIFMTGPLTGSTFPASPRVVVCSRSPLTNIWGEANAGGYWGAELKKAGYDGIVLLGKSTKPTVIYIEDDNIKFAPAADLWGKDVYEVQSLLKENGKVACIGPAGENQISMASIALSMHNFFGRAGIGAVMGSKNLKAVVVKGSSNKYQYADPDEAKKVRARMLEKIKANPFLDHLKAHGSNGIGMLYSMGDSPIKNWQLGRWDDDKIHAISVDGFEERGYVTGHSTCFACPIACKTNLKVDDEKYPIEYTAGPEYETAAGFGSLILNDNPAIVAKGNELCNRYGMDTMSVSAVIALAMECYERGYITRKDTGDMAINWGDGDMIVELLHEIGQNKGFGARLAMGSDVFVSDLDPAAKECVTTVKGLEAPFHEPRLNFDMGAQYATGYRGACHVSSYLNVESGLMKFPTMMGTAGPIPTAYNELALLEKKIQDLGCIFGSGACYCYFGGDDIDEFDLTESINTATGFEYSFDDIMDAGERAWCLKRALSNLWGLRSKDDRLPKRLSVPLDDGPLAGLPAPDIDLFKVDFYKLRGIDEDGLLSAEIMAKTEIPEHIVQELLKLKEA